MNELSIRHIEALTGESSASYFDFGAGAGAAYSRVKDRIRLRSAVLIEPRRASFARLSAVAAEAGAVACNLDVSHPAADAPTVEDLFRSQGPAPAAVIRLGGTTDARRVIEAAAQAVDPSTLLIVLLDEPAMRNDAGVAEALSAAGLVVDPDVAGLFVRQVVRPEEPTAPADEVAELKTHLRRLETALSQNEETAAARNGELARLASANRFLVTALRRERHGRNKALKAQKEKLESRFSYRLGKRLLEARNPARWLGLPAALRADWRRSREASTGADHAADEILDLSAGPRLVTAEPVFAGVALIPDRALFLAGTVTRSVENPGEPLVAVGRYVDANGRALAEAADIAPVQPFASGAFLLLIPHPRDAVRLELGFRAPRGDTALLVLDVIQRPRPEVAEKWFARAEAQGEAALAELLHLRSAASKAPAPTLSPALAKADAGKTPRRASRALALGNKLFGGYSRIAAPALEALRDDPSAPDHERATAAWELARWRFTDGDFDGMLSELDAVRAIRRRDNKDGLVYRALSLIRLKRFDEAFETLGEIDRRFGRLAGATFLRSTAVRGQLLRQGADLEIAQNAQLEIINRLLSEADAAPIRLRDPSRPMTLSNIEAEAPDAAGPQAEKVSVLMPAYNAAATIEVAIDSLLRQTWRNIEIVVVDDCSQDDTAAVVERMAARDSRVRLIQSERNQGAYPSRNIALAAAVGDVFTVHDSDDWSHPEKIERQIRPLLEDPALKATMSHWIRVTDTLEAIGPWIPKPSLFDLNFSSLLVRRSVERELGPWDEVRVTGDAEYRSRIMAAYGDDAIRVVKAPVFLSLALVREDSLTNAGPTSVRTLRYGLRGQYRGAYAHWHGLGAGQPERLRMISGARPYVAPMGVTIERGRERRYDLVVVCDFALYGGAFGSTLNYILAARAAGLSVAVYHWRKYDLRADAPLNPRLYQVCFEHGVDILTVGDAVSAETVMIGYPAILQHLPDALPQVDTDNLIVIINQFASRLIDGSDEQYDPLVARRNLMTLFGLEGVWIPISNWVARLMREDERYPAPHAEAWHPMIRTEDWFGRPIRWNGRDRARPVVGRHSRDAYTKWPMTPEALRAAYGAGQAWDVRLMGGVKRALEIIGETPENWTVAGFDGLTVPEFLDDLDFFIHYPHERYIEEFGRAVLEAMAAGKPVVLPPQFRETFGESALYAEPQDLPDVINGLWADEAAYLARAEIGRAFVARSDLKKFPERLARALAAHPRPAVPALTAEAGARGD